MHNVLHPRDVVDRVCVSRKEWGRQLASIEDNVDASRQRHEVYTEKRGGKLITATRNNSDYTMTHRPEITRNQKGQEKQHYVTF